MEWILVVLAGGALVGAGRQLLVRRAARKVGAEELEQIERLAGEDVTQFGEELTRLGEQVRADDLDADGRLDYQRALAAYEAAQQAVARLRSASDVSTITDTLASGRYAIVCVQARSAGQPVPERRVPCYFNPQHGPSTTDVVWNQPKYGTRKVAVCAQDAARLRSGEDPEIRMVVIGNRRVPYWEAGNAVVPYSSGYFAQGGGARYVAEASIEGPIRRIGDGHH
ncbi:hypothetical protein AB0L70_17540 [Kribbella sp. NPDC051952]|uniref:hypothetical protein n=1 Tax=Kribbella sp. NPDC051952 TaxID=3154851 RepID=UPI0034218E28